MSALLTGPTALSPWIEKATVECLQKTPPNPTATATTTLVITGTKRIAQVVGTQYNKDDVLLNNNDNGDAHSPWNDTKGGTLTLSDGAATIVAVIPSKVRASLVHEQAFAVGCLVRLPGDWRITTEKLLLCKQLQQQRVNKDVEISRHDITIATTNNNNNTTNSTEKEPGDALRMHVGGHIEIIGSRGLSTVGEPKDIHQCIGVRCLLASITWVTMRQRLLAADESITRSGEHLQHNKASLPDANNPTPTNTEKASSVATAAVNHTKTTTTGIHPQTTTTTIAATATAPATPANQTPIQLGNVSDLLGLTATSGISPVLGQLDFVKATTTDEMQPLLGRVLAAANEARQEEAQCMADSQAAHERQLLQQQQGNNDSNGCDPLGISAMLVIDSSSSADEGEESKYNDVSDDDDNEDNAQQEETQTTDYIKEASNTTPDIAEATSSDGIQSLPNDTFRLPDDTETRGTIATRHASAEESTIVQSYSQNDAQNEETNQTNSPSADPVQEKVWKHALAVDKHKSVDSPRELGTMNSSRLSMVPEDKEQQEEEEEEEMLLSLSFTQAESSETLASHQNGGFPRDARTGSMDTFSLTGKQAHQESPFLETQEQEVEEEEEDDDDFGVGFLTQAPGVDVGFPLTQSASQRNSDTSHFFRSTEPMSDLMVSQEGTGTRDALVEAAGRVPPVDQDPERATTPMDDPDFFDERMELVDVPLSDDSGNNRSVAKQEDAPPHAIGVEHSLARDDTIVHGTEENRTMEEMGKFFTQTLETQGFDEEQNDETQSYEGLFCQPINDETSQKTPKKIVETPRKEEKTEKTRQYSLNLSSTLGQLPRKRKMFAWRNAAGNYIDILLGQSCGLLEKDPMKRVRTNAELAGDRLRGLLES